MYAIMRGQGATSILNVGCGAQRQQKRHEVWTNCPKILDTDVGRIRSYEERKLSRWCTGHAAADCQCRGPRGFDMAMATHSIYYFSPEEWAAVLRNTTRRAGYSLNHRFQSCGGFFKESEYLMDGEGIVTMHVRGNSVAYRHPAPGWMYGRESCSVSGGERLHWQQVGASVFGTPIFRFDLDRDDTVDATAPRLGLESVLQDSRVYADVAFGGPPEEKNTLRPTWQPYEIASVYSHGVDLIVRLVDSKYGRRSIIAPKGLIGEARARMAFKERTPETLRVLADHLRAKARAYNLPTDMVAESVNAAIQLGFAAGVEGELATLHTIGRNRARIQRLNTELKEWSPPIDWTKWLWVLLALPFAWPLLRMMLKVVYFGIGHAAFANCMPLVAGAIGVRALAALDYYGVLPAVRRHLVYGFAGQVVQSRPNRLKWDGTGAGEKHRPSNWQFGVSVGDRSQAVFANNAHNEHAAIRVRCARPLRPIKIVLWNEFVSWVMHHRRKLFPWLRVTAVDFEAWLHRFPVSLRLHLIRGRQRAEAGDFRGCYTTNCFVKREKGEDTDFREPELEKSPRAIMASTAVYNACVGPWCVGLGARLKRHWRRDSIVLYGGGLNAVATGRIIHGWSESGLTPIETDMKKYDSSRHERSRELVNELCRLWGADEHRIGERSVYQHMRAANSTTGFSRNGLSFRLTDFLCSGRPFTTTDNTIMNALTFLFAMCRVHRLDYAKLTSKDLQVLVTGDDRLAASRWAYTPAVAKVETELGFDPEVAHTPTWEHVTFCSARPYPALVRGQATAVMGPKLGRLFNRIGWVCDPPSECVSKRGLRARAWEPLVRGIMLGLKSAAPHVAPILACADAHLRVLGAGATMLPRRLKTFMDVGASVLPDPVRCRAFIERVYECSSSYSYILAAYSAVTALPWRLSSEAVAQLSQWDAAMTHGTVPGDGAAVLHAIILAPLLEEIVKAWLGAWFGKHGGLVFGIAEVFINGRNPSLLGTWVPVFFHWYSVASGWGYWRRVLAHFCYNSSVCAVAAGAGQLLPDDLLIRCGVGWALRGGLTTVPIYTEHMCFPVKWANLPSGTQPVMLPPFVHNDTDCATTHPAVHCIGHVTWRHLYCDLAFGHDDPAQYQSCAKSHLLRIVWHSVTNTQFTQLEMSRTFQPPKLSESVLGGPRKDDSSVLMRVTPRLTYEEEGKYFTVTNGNQVLFGVRAASRRLSVISLILDQAPEWFCITLSGPRSRLTGPLPAQGNFTLAVTKATWDAVVGEEAKKEADLDPIGSLAALPTTPLRPLVAIGDDGDVEVLYHGDGKKAVGAAGAGNHKGDGPDYAGPGFMSGAAGAVHGLVPRKSPAPGAYLTRVIERADLPQPQAQRVDAGRAHPSLSTVAQRQPAPMPRRGLVERAVHGTAEALGPVVERAAAAAPNALKHAVAIAAGADAQYHRKYPPPPAAQQAPPTAQPKPRTGQEVVAAIGAGAKAGDGPKQRNNRTATRQPKRGRRAPEVPRMDRVGQPAPGPRPRIQYPPMAVRGPRRLLRGDVFQRVPDFKAAMHSESFDADGNMRIVGSDYVQQVTLASAENTVGRTLAEFRFNPRQPTVLSSRLWSLGFQCFQYNRVWFEFVPALSEFFGGTYDHLFDSDPGDVDGAGEDAVRQAATTPSSAEEKITRKHVFMFDAAKQAGGRYYIAPGTDANNVDRLVYQGHVKLLLVNPVSSSGSITWPLALGSWRMHYDLTLYHRQVENQIQTANTIATWRRTGASTTHFFGAGPDVVSPQWGSIIASVTTLNDVVPSDINAAALELKFSFAASGSRTFLVAFGSECTFTVGTAANVTTGIVADGVHCTNVDWPSSTDHVGTDNSMHLNASSNCAGCTTYGVLSTDGSASAWFNIRIRAAVASTLTVGTGHAVDQASIVITEIDPSSVRLPMKRTRGVALAPLASDTPPAPAGKHPEYPPAATIGRGFATRAIEDYLAIVATSNTPAASQQRKTNG